MLGSHDSMTYLPARHRVFELFSFLWRTQTKNIINQRESGVGYLDVRIRHTTKGWQLCHGLVDLDLRFVKLDNLLSSLKNFKIRLILERGDTTAFRLIAPTLAEKYSNLCFMGIKKGWEVLLNRDPQIVDMTFVPWLSGVTFKQNIKRLWNMIKTHQRLSIKSFAHSIPPLSNEELNSEVVYFRDMV